MFCICVVVIAVISVTLCCVVLCFCCVAGLVLRYVSLLGCSGIVLFVCDLLYCRRCLLHCRGVNCCVQMCCVVFCVVVVSQALICVVVCRDCRSRIAAYLCCCGGSGF